MSLRLINRSPDLKRLRDEGYDLEIRRGHLLVKGVPYVDSQRRVRYGILGSTIDLADDITIRPTTHVALFSGDHPCHKDGSIFHEIAHSSSPNAVDGELVFHHSFSSKPPNGYADYYEKMTTYVGIISSPAQQLES